MRVGAFKWLPFPFSPAEIKAAMSGSPVCWPEWVELFFFGGPPGPGGPGGPGSPANED